MVQPKALRTMRKLSRPRFASEHLSKRSDKEEEVVNMGAQDLSEFLNMKKIPSGWFSPKIKIFTATQRMLTTVLQKTSKDKLCTNVHQRTPDRATVDSTRSRGNR